MPPPPRKAPTPKASSAPPGRKPQVSPPASKKNAPPPTRSSSSPTHKPPPRKAPPAADRKIDPSNDGYDSPEVDSDEEEADNNAVENVRKKPLPPAKPSMPKNDLPPPPKEDPDSKIRHVIYNIAIGKLSSPEEMKKEWFWDEKKDGKLSYDTTEWLCEKLRVAASLGKYHGVEFLLGKGADIDGFDIDGNTALHFAVMGNGPLEDQKKTIKVLFDAGADSNRTNHDDKSPKGINFKVCKAQVDYLRELDIAKKEKPAPVEDDGPDDQEPVYRARTELTSVARDDPF
eukprot:gb/GEZN01014048.1/.p1 GENE.gb/GEZN01014048.1/~~gb/GEZN01014048.1/.p1  ORF type:complete len:287 (-),score=64.87 gb/GEZN01014048.1/:32-892(-)